MNFEELEVRQDVIKALHELGIKEPTTIQQKAIPLVHQGKDVIGMSRTGSGKTAAFGIPIVEMVQKGQGIQSLILSPTRELAFQISGELKKFSKYLNLNVVTIFGGVAIQPQMDQLQRADIVVGTPGRILDHLGRRTLNLSKVRCFVLDEADKMVEMGFIEDIDQILSFTPPEKQVLLFGATISREIEKLQENHMDNPVKAEAEIHVEKDLLEQFYYEVEAKEKFSLLVHLLKKDEERGRVIIFCSARSTVEAVYSNLRDNGIKAEMIHGKLTQNRRLKVIEGFNKGKVDILIASSVAARGLHIEDVTHVFNYDLSQDPQEYIHRVGRTARAGQSGKAITLLGPRDHDTFRQVINRYGIPVEELPKEKFPALRFQIRSRDNNRFGDRRHHAGGYRSHSSGGYRSGSSDRSNNIGERGYSRPKRKPQSRSLTRGNSGTWNNNG